MITCPWCGTNYEDFQPNCDNCGGSLPLPSGDAPAHAAPVAVREIPLTPPLPPRQVPNKVMGRMLLADTGAIIAGVLLLIGGIIFMVGVPLVIAIITLPVGVPFSVLGFIFLVIGGVLFYRRVDHAFTTVALLREGQAALGEITNVTQNYQVRVNNRYPWMIEYAFKVHGIKCKGKLSTLSQPDLSQQPGKAVYVLYDLEDPVKSTLYPSPYGYFGL